MLLRLFRSLAEALESDSALLGHSESPRLFRKVGTPVGEPTNAAWIDRNGASATPLVAAILEKTSEVNPIVQGAPQSTDVCFFVETVNAVMHAPFRATPNKPSLQQYAVALDNAVQRETLRFWAGHNDLTGLPNRQAFDVELRDALAPWIPGQGAVTDESTGDQGSQESPQPPRRRPLWLMAMDIDHFKQINDSYDHQHGDIVLQAFGQRIAVVAQELQQDFPTARFSVAHPSGEEFFLLAVGELSDIQAETAADKVRLAIRNTPLPNEDEWRSLAPHRGKPNTPPPPLRERNMTVSIGIVPERTVLNDPKAITSSSAAAGKLKEYAEDALHRAKNGGRDAVCNFTKIIERHGTVLEHNPETDLVVIDVGRSVNVIAGMRFDVFHPDFAAPLRPGEEKPYVFADGRTEKRIGLYPEWASGLVEVVEVQGAISFCTIVERKNNLAFAKGYRLKLRSQTTAKLRKRRKTLDAGTSAQETPAPASDNQASSSGTMSSDRPFGIVLSNKARGVSREQAPTSSNPSTGKPETSQRENEARPDLDQAAEGSSGQSVFRRPSEIARLMRRLENTPGKILEILTETERTGRSIGIAVFSLASPRAVVQARGRKYASVGLRNLALVANAAAEHGLAGRAIRKYEIVEDLPRGRVILAMIPRHSAGGGGTVSELATLVLEYATSRSDGVRLFRAGVFEPAELTSLSGVSDVDRSKLRLGAAFQYAIIALEAQNLGVRGLVPFSSAVAVSVFERTASGRGVTAKEVERLYQKFIELGIDTGELHLAAAAALWQLTRARETDSHTFREAAFRAVSLLPDDPRARRTAALSALTMRNIDEAFEHYEIAAKIGGAEGIEGAESLALQVLIEYATKHPDAARGSTLFRALKTGATKPQNSALSQMIQRSLDTLIKQFPRA
jgi:GGDEF domain-containing protein